MFLTPLVMLAAPHVSRGAQRFRRLERLVAGGGEPMPAPVERGAHVIVVGYGVAGRMVCQALRDCEVPYVILDISGRKVRRLREKGEPAHYADVAAEETLVNAGLARARALVLLVNDEAASERAIVAARRLAPSVPVFVRTQFFGSVPALMELGATDVVSEEVEAGAEALARVLREVGLPRNVVADRIREAREQTMSSARGFTLPRRRLGEMPELLDLKIETFLAREGAWCVGRSAVDMQLRTRTGALIVSGSRDGKLLPHPDPHDPIVAGDVLYLVGDGDALTSAFDLLENGPAAPAASAPSA
jgi:CPA2 family monovalent cation:H+ antiporter-2